MTNDQNEPAKNDETGASRDHEVTQVHGPLGVPAQVTDSHFHSKYSRKLDPKQGGMAIVWKAYDGRLQREVAYKEIRPEHSGDSGIRAMFLHEAQVTGQLEHPNIIPVYELGDVTDVERPFYTMQYVDGMTLTEVIRGHHDSANDRLTREGLSSLLNIFLKVSNAVAYAHSRGVVHRDLKPDNVMVGNFGEVLVLDWGLAKVISANETDLPAVRSASTRPFQTEVGVRKGTPAYWAPEQQQGQVELIDQRTDVYGLGSVLYEILTDRAPHARIGDSKDSTVSAGTVVTPRTVERYVPPALDGICNKAMAKKRSERYSTANEMAHDIERYLMDAPVTAYRDKLSDQALRIIRQNQWVSLVAGVSVAVIVLLAFVFAEQYKNARQSSLDREKRALSAFASEERSELSSNVESMRQDVTFLGSLAEVADLLRLSNTLSEESAGPEENQATPNEVDSSDQNRYTEKATHLESVFSAFLTEKLDYVQVRLLDRRGQELVRVDRRKPGDPPFIVDGDSLQNKKDRPYFIDAIGTKRGDWYLSNIELNQEAGRKQKDLPVIRGAVPIFIEEDDAQPFGILIVNLHFQELVKSMGRFSSNETNGMVYLTDEEGRFLYHPQPDLAFCFERGLNYQIQHLYPSLQEAYQSSQAERPFDNERPQTALWVRPVIRSNRPRDIQEIHASTKLNLEQRLLELAAKYPNLKSQVGLEGEAAIYGVTEKELNVIESNLRASVGKPLEMIVLPRVERDELQTVHFNRLPLDHGDDNRFLALTLVISNDSVAPDAREFVFILAVVSLLCLVATVATYFFTRQGRRHVFAI